MRHVRKARRSHKNDPRRVQKYKNKIVHVAKLFHSADMISIERPKHEPKMQNIAQPTFHQVQPTKKQKQEEQMDTQDQTRTDSMDKSSRHTQDMSWQRTLLHFNENFSNQIESTDQRGNALHKPGTELTKPIHRTNKLCSGGIRSLDIRSRSVTILGFHLNEPR